ncbi:MAG: hypothetical protein AB7O52_01455 [Planctomycetota bacterium]
MLAGIGVAAIGLALLPHFASPYVESTAEEALRDALGATGELDGVVVRWFGGVDVGAGRFERPDKSLEISWRSVRSDVSVTDALAASRIHAGSELVIDGLRVVYRPAAPAEEPQSATDEVSPTEPRPAAAEPQLLRLPSVRLLDAEFHWLAAGRELHLEEIQFHSGAPVDVALGSNFAAGLGLEEVARPTVTLQATHTEGDARWSSFIDLSATVGPGSRSDRLSGSIALQLRDMAGTLPSRPRADGTATRAVTLEPSRLDLDASVADFVPRAEAQESAGWPLDLEALASLTSGFTLVVPALAIGDLQVSDLAGSGSVRESRAELRIERSQLNGGSVSGSAALDRDAWQTTIHAAEILTTRDVIHGLSYISPLFAMARRSPAQLDCRIGFDADFSGATTLVEPLERLTATGELRTSDASFAVPAEFEPFVALLSAKDRKHLHLAGVRQPFEIREGKILNRGFELTTSEASALIEGFTSIGGELTHRVQIDRAVGKLLDGKGGRDWAPVAAALAKQPVRIEGTIAEPRIILPELLRADTLVPSLLDAGLEVLDRETRKPDAGETKQSPEELLDKAIDKGLDSLFKKKRKKTEDSPQ